MHYEQLKKKLTKWFPNAEICCEGKKTSLDCLEY